MVLNLPLAAFKAALTGFDLQAVFLKKSLTALCLKTCIRCWRLCKGRVVCCHGGVCIPFMKRPKSQGAVISGEHLLCGSTNRLVFCLPQLHLLHSSFLAACKQPVEMRETPFDMSDKHTFEMTCSFHTLAWHKVRKCTVCWLHLGRVKDSRWPEAPGSLPNQLPVALNSQHNTPHSTVRMYARRCVCQSMQLTVDWNRKQQHKNTLFIIGSDFVRLNMFCVSVLSKLLCCIYDSDIATLLCIIPVIHHCDYRHMLFNVFSDCFQSEESDKFFSLPSPRLILLCN